MSIQKSYKPTLEYQRSCQLRMRVDSNHEMLKIWHRVEQGVRGEKLFSDMTTVYARNSEIYYDLHLTAHEKEFQIDCLMVIQDIIYLFEIKHFNFDLILQDDRFYFTDGREEFSNLRLQKERTCALFTQFLTCHKLDYTFNYYHVFMNQNQQLYGLLPHHHCLTYYSIQKFLHELTQIPNFYHHNQLDYILLKEHQLFSRYQKSYDISFDAMTKGVICECEEFFLKKKSTRQVICQCGRIMSNESFLKLAVDELILLFQDEQFTVKQLDKWTNGLIARKTISRFLEKHFDGHNHTKGRYYTLKK